MLAQEYRCSELGKSSSPYNKSCNKALFLKDKSGVDKIIVKKQPYQLLNTSREFFPSFRGLNFHKFDDQFS